MPKFSKILLFLDKVKLLDLALKVKSSNLVVIAYHNVGYPNSLQPQPFEEPLPPTLIEKHVLTLLRNGYIVTSLGEALNILNEDPSKKIAVITFDDGYKGIYDYVYPILRKYNIKATLYITAGFIKYRVAPWWEQLYFIINKAGGMKKLCEQAQLIDLAKDELLKACEVQANSLKPWIKKVVRMNDVLELENLINIISEILGIDIPEDFYITTMLDLDEIKEMVEYGLEIGGHGLWHVNLTILNESRLMEEIEGSLNFIKSIYKGIYTFAYPFGIYNNDVIKVLISKGFKAAVTLDPQLNRLPIANVYTIARIPPYRFGLKDIASFKWTLITG